MAVLYIVIPIALVLAGAGLAAFLWAVRKGQFDDLDTPAVRMLFDDDDSKPDQNNDQS
ncbi:MAG: cbb3-type cytochrome oxidase assembly protein CcoS [Planctomycetota bacterium]